jgi:hypothetical protein
MITQSQFRYAKPITANLRGLVKARSVSYQDTSFTDYLVMVPINRNMFDVFTLDGITLNREEGFFPEYYFEDGKLVVREPGDYIVRVYSEILPFEDTTINVTSNMVQAEGNSFVTSIPFWPQILGQPQNGVARVSNDGRRMSYVSNGFTGNDSFSYRMVNAYGQVSEPACCYVTAAA